MKQLLKALAGHVRARRKKLGLTQEQFAEQAGLITNYVARLELGTSTPSMSALISLSKALDMSVSELLSMDARYTWRDSAEEIARTVESMNEWDAGFVIDQLHAIARYIKCKEVREPD